MATLVGIGAVSKNDNKEITILKARIKELEEEINLLNIEKFDLEKLPKELSKKNEELTKQISNLEAEKEELSKKNEELTKNSKTKKEE